MIIGPARTVAGDITGKQTAPLAWALQYFFGVKTTLIFQCDASLSHMITLIEHAWCWG